MMKKDHLLVNLKIGVHFPGDYLLLYVMTVTHTYTREIVLTSEHHENRSFVQKPGYNAFGYLMELFTIVLDTIGRLDIKMGPKCYEKWAGPK